MAEPTHILSDYQLIEMLDVYMISGAVYVMNFVAVLFGFLVAIFVAGNRMSKMMLIIVASLYSLFAVGSGFGLYVAQSWYVEIANELAYRGTDATGRITYPVHMLAGFPGQLFRAATMLVYFATYVGGLVFLKEVLASKGKTVE